MDDYSQHLISVPEEKLKEEWVQNKCLKFIEEFSSQFPFYVIVEGHYPSHDFATRWCWNQFGPYSGPCVDVHSEYPGCDKVLATETINKHEYKEYRNPGNHEHDGVWRCYWIGKTGYDYGIAVFAFSVADNKNQFENLLTEKYFGLGENYSGENEA